MFILLILLQIGQKRLAEDNGNHMENCPVKKLKRNHKSVTHKRKISKFIFCYRYMIKIVTILELNMTPVNET